MDSVSRTKGLDHLPFSQCVIWLKKADILDMKQLSITDLGMRYFRFRKRALDYENFLKLLEELAETKNLSLQEMIEKLEVVKKPELPKQKKRRQQ